MKYVPVGRIVSAHGIKGEIKFRYYNDEKEVFYSYTSFFVKSETGWANLQRTGTKFHKGYFYITFKGLDMPDDVSSLVNRELFVKERDLPELSENEYYEYQLIGLDVLNKNGESLGKVAEIVHTGANDVLLVRGEKEILIPMIEEYIDEINLEKALVQVKGETVFI